MTDQALLAFVDRHAAAVAAVAVAWLVTRASIRIAAFFAVLWRTR
jgi:hypothetical protein